MLGSVVNLYNTLMSHADTRHADWPLLGSPLPTITLCLCYVAFVKVIGPKLMEYRKPFELKGPMLAYNIIMVIVCSYCVYIQSGDWLNDYSWKCQPVDYSRSPKAMTTLRMAYTYFLLKFVEFTDTIFFVLRKKNSQISTLHVIHHGILPFSVWWGLKFVPGGHATFFTYLNNSVHVVMYGYYALAALGPRVAPFLWWKKYLTAFQMVQFVGILVHSFQLFFRPSCDFPKSFGVWIGSHAVLFWFLFSRFYTEAYNKSGNKSSLPSKLQSTAAAMVTSCNPQHQQMENSSSRTSVRNKWDENGNCKPNGKLH